MKVEQIYTASLAEAAYYIESKGEAAVIDPLRETEPYLERAKNDGAKIKYILETHFHADFVSGHLDLKEKTGASIVYGPTAEPNFDARVVKDGEVLNIGDITITALHTPGHTMESTTYLLKDENGKDYAIFSGDTLFMGDVGRPDLAIKEGEITEKDLAGLLFDSLRNKIMPLPEDIIVYPGHGAGSACGKKMARETFGTLGAQKATNYALRDGMTREEFIKEVTMGLVTPPQYFSKNAMVNKMGYESLDTIKSRGSKPLSINAFKAAWEGEKALVIDTRNMEVFSKGFIPGSIYIGLDGSFAMWVGALIPDLMQPILFIADTGKENEVVTRLARVGYDNPIGYLKGGFKTWQQAGEDIDDIEEISATELSKVNYKSLYLLDTRKESEYNTEHIKGASLFPLDAINRNMAEIKKNRRYYLYCATGFRSLVAASILKARGYHQVVNVTGGYQEMVDLPMERTDYVEQITDL